MGRWTRNGDFPSLLAENRRENGLRGIKRDTDVQKNKSIMPLIALRTESIMMKQPDLLYFSKYSITLEENVKKCQTG